RSSEGRPREEAAGVWRRTRKILRIAGLTSSRQWRYWEFTILPGALGADPASLDLLAFAAGHHGGAVIALAVPDKAEAPADAEFVLDIRYDRSDLTATAACDRALLVF